MIRDRALEDKLRVGYARRARVLIVIWLIALVLIACLWLFTLDAVRTVALSVDRG